MIDVDRFGPALSYEERCRVCQHCGERRGDHGAGRDACPVMAWRRVVRYHATQRFADGGTFRDAPPWQRLGAELVEAKLLRGAQPAWTANRDEMDRVVSYSYWGNRAGRS